MNERRESEIIDERLARRIDEAVSRLEKRWEEELEKRWGDVSTDFFDAHAVAPPFKDELRHLMVRLLQRLDAESGEHGRYQRRSGGGTTGTILTILGTGIALAMLIGGRVGTLDDRQVEMNRSVAVLQTEMREVREDVGRILEVIEDGTAAD